MSARKSTTRAPRRAEAGVPRAAARSGRAQGDDLGATIRELAALLNDLGLSELEVERGGSRVRLRAGGEPVAVAAASPAAAASTAPSPAAEAPEEDSAHYVTSPFVGTFYRSSSPGEPPFVEVGQTARKGQVLCIVEAMKLMNEIEADVDGRIEAILADSGEPVEYGERLFKMRPL